MHQFVNEEPAAAEQFIPYDLDENMLPQRYNLVTLKKLMH